MNHFQRTEDQRCSDFQASNKAVQISSKVKNVFNPIALRKAKIVYSFGLSEYNRVNVKRKREHKLYLSEKMLCSLPRPFFYQIIIFVSSHSITLKVNLISEHEC